MRQTETKCLHRNATISQKGTPAPGDGLQRAFNCGPFYFQGWEKVTTILCSQTSPNPHPHTHTDSLAACCQVSTVLPTLSPPEERKMKEFRILFL